MTHTPRHTPFSAAQRSGRLDELVPALPEGIIDFFGPSVAARRAQTAKRGAASKLLDRERTGGQLEELRAAVAAKVAEGKTPREALLEAVTDNPALLGSEAFSNIDMLQKALKPAAPIQGQPGTQLLDPGTGEKRGEQVPFKPDLAPADERMVDAILKAREAGDEARVRLLTAALLKDNTTTLSKNVSEVFRLRAKAEELRKTPGKEKEASDLEAQAALLEETLKSSANFMADFMKNFFVGGGGDQQAAPTGPEPPLAGAGRQAPAVAPTATPPGAVVPLPGATQAPTPGPTGGLTQSDQQILALPLAEIEQRQLVALLSRPAGIEAFRQLLAQQRLQAVPGGGPTVPGTTGAIAPGPALGGTGGL